MILGSTITPEEGVPFAAEIFVSNLEKTLQYYCEVLGFEIHRLDKKGRFAALKFNNSIFMVQEEDNLEKLQRVGVSLRFIIDARRNLQRISPAVSRINKSLSMSKMKSLNTSKTESFLSSRESQKKEDSRNHKTTTRKP